MPSYILACEQVGVPSTVIAPDGSIAMQCPGGTVSLIEYQPSIFVPLSADAAMTIASSVALIFAVAWVFRLLSNFLEGKNHETS
jgi:hypothetical protein